MTSKIQSISDYLNRLDRNQKMMLQKIRREIHSAIPSIEECMSYGIPAFKYRGKYIAGFAATKEGFSYYPFSGTTLSTLKADTRAFSKTKSALHFSNMNPIPPKLIRKLLFTRISELPKNPDNP